MPGDAAIAPAPRLRLLLATILLLLSTLAFVPTTEARTDPTSWTETSLGSLTGAVIPDRLQIAHNGEKVGLVYHTTNTLSFLLKPDATSAWVAKNLDLTGSVNANSNYAFANGGTSTWAVFMSDTATSLDKWFYSTDDGTTWTLGGTRFWGSNPPQLMSISIDGTSAAVLSWQGAGTRVSCLTFEYTANYVTTGNTYVESISDNTGTPGSSCSATYIATNGADMVVGASQIDVWFKEAGTSSVFHITGDGHFWGLPYNTEGGSTKTPLSTANCPGTGAPTSAALSVAGSSSDMIEASLHKNGAGNSYLCTATTSSSEAYPSSTPTPAVQDSAQNGNSENIASNGQQFIVAARQGTSNYVLYKATSSSGAWTQKYSTASNSGVFLVEATPTRAYFVFTDVDLHSGRLTVASAVMVPDVLGQGKIFCATKDQGANFGYDDQGGSTVGLSGGEEIQLGGDDDEPAWLGKSWGGVNPTASGVHFARVFFTINDDSDDVGTAAGKFRATFTNTPAGGTVASPTLNDGDKDHTGDFANSVDAFFQETGEQWTVRFYYTVAGGARIPFGSSFIGDDTNTPTQYVLEVNTNGDGGPRYLALKYSNTTDVPGMNFTIPAEAAKNNAFWYEQWFIAESVNLIAAAQTDLQNNGLSTCIFGPAGATPNPNGDAGRLVSSGNVTGSATSSLTGEFLGVDLDSAAEQAGIGTEALRWFLGVLLIAGLTYGIGALFQGAMAIILAVFGGFLGLGLAIGFGLIPLWFAVLIFLGCAATIVVARR